MNLFSGAALAGCLLALSGAAMGAEFIDASKMLTTNAERQGHAFGGSGPNVEEGSLDGVPYRFFHEDGSGFVGDWIVECDRDAMTDRRVCWTNRDDLWVYAAPNSKGIVSVGDEHFPGSQVHLRIGSSKPFSASSKNNGDFAAATSATIMRRLLASENVTTRYMRWPYKEWVDHTTSLKAFAQVWRYLNWAVNANK